MARNIAREHVDKLALFKKNIKNSYDTFKPNYDRYNEFRRFVFESSYSSDEITLLQTLGKPQLEFNISEAYISRLLGEFSKQEPDIMVSADDQGHADPMIIAFLEQHGRHVLSDANNEHVRYELYKDLLSGGFGVLKVHPEYAHSMSLDYVIKISRCEPTLCGFDPLARLAHKGDGQFCFELYPYSLDEFEELGYDVDIDKLSFAKTISGFQWAYLNDNTKIVMVADYYQKKKKRKKIVKLVDGRVMTVEDYEKERASYDGIRQFPATVGQSRMTEIDTIYHYRIMDTEILDVKETDYKHLPLVFTDGNSVLLRTNKNGNIHQFTRPYPYHAKGAQRLKNFAGVTLANELENMVQHKFKVSKESLPKEADFLEAYKNPQKASVLVYNEFFEQNPDARTTPPQEIQRVPTPPEVTNAFVGADSLIQNILGSYDASLGINNNQLSGIAIVEAATQSNAAAMPYIVGYLQGLQRAFEIYIDLLPKYVTTPRTMPVKDEEGKRNFVLVNPKEGQEGVPLFYDSNIFNVVVRAGASFSVQKSRTIMMIKELMGMSPLMQQFIAEKGLNFVLDNMEGKGIEQLKAMVDEWVQEYEKNKQMAMQAQQQQMMNNPQVLKAQNDRMKIQQEGQLSSAELQYKTMDSQAKHTATLAKALAEQARSEADIAIAKIKTRHDLIDKAHKHAKDIATHLLNKEIKNEQQRQRKKGDMERSSERNA